MIEKRLKCLAKWMCWWITLTSLIEWLFQLKIGLHNIYELGKGSKICVSCQMANIRCMQWSKGIYLLTEHLGKNEKIELIKQRNIFLVPTISSRQRNKYNHNPKRRKRSLPPQNPFSKNIPQLLVKAGDLRSLVTDLITIRFSHLIFSCTFRQGKHKFKNQIWFISICRS